MCATVQKYITEFESEKLLLPILYTIYRIFKKIDHNIPHPNEAVFELNYMMTQVPLNGFEG